MIAPQFKPIFIRSFALIPVAMFCLLAVLAIPGCGPSDEQRIQEALSQQLDATKDKDPTVCSALISDDAKQKLSNAGIDADTFATAFLDGFDYSLGQVAVDKDTASVDITLTSKTLSSVTNQLNQYAQDDYSSGASANSTEDDIRNQVAQASTDAVQSASPVQHQPITVTLHKQNNTWIVDQSINGDIAKAFLG